MWCSSAGPAAICATRRGRWCGPSARETGADWTEVDIDADTTPGRDLVAELGELVPVVEVDGVQQGYWRIDANRLRRTLTAAGPRPLA